MSAFIHISVLSEELIAGLEIQAGGHYLDATVGGGGHSKLILATAPDVTIVAIDRDGSAITAAKETLADYGERVQFWQGNFVDYPGKEAEDRKSVV